MREADPADHVVSRVACIVLAIVFLVGLLHLWVRLRDVQVESAADYGYASARQSFRRVQICGSRGRILDCKGRVLADNRTSISIDCRPASFQQKTWEAMVQNIESNIVRLGELIGRKPQVETKTIRRHIRQSIAMPLTIWRDIRAAEVARFAEHESEFPGFELSEREERVYPNGSLAAHLLGYVGRDRGKSAAGDEQFSYFSPEMRGRAGIEYYYDDYLRGSSGERKLLVDARGFSIHEWTVVEPQKGLDVHLTLDQELQRVVEHQLKGECGACVVLDPRTGNILAAASLPEFNPNDFVPTLKADLYDRLSSDSNQPLLDRAFGGSYAPGSTFKPIVALAGLTLGYPADKTYCCDGRFGMGSMVIRCARRWGHGEMDLRHAMMKSCNPFFCNLGMDIGTNALLQAAFAFGLGARTGIDFGVDACGIIPDAELKMRKYNEPWFAGDLAQMSIGQGMVLVSPLQMAIVAGALGTGYRVKPHLKAHSPTERHPLPFAAEHLKIVREGMSMVVDGDDGSRGGGWRGGENVAVKVSGKTGTAEVGRGLRRRKNTWFIAYAPRENPTVAIALVVENGESGGSTAAPRVGAVLRHIFGTTRESEVN